MFREVLREKCKRLRRKTRKKVMVERVSASHAG
jgi:hypothetical protein